MEQIERDESSVSPAGRRPLVAVESCSLPPSRKRLVRGVLWWLGLGVLIGLGMFVDPQASAAANTFEWREEAALHDGGMIVLSWWVQLVPGQPFHYIVGEQRLTFTHPTTRQQIVWVDSGKVGSRLNPVLLDVHGEQPYLVGVPQTGPDEDGFGCPTPPYIVFRYEGGLWRRLPFTELPTRFVNANIVGYGSAELIRESNGYLTAAQVQSRVDRMRRDPQLEHRGRIDRRIRNPLSLGCSRGAVERIYGAAKYTEWWRTGNWLDKTDEEARRLLPGKREETKP